MINRGIIRSATFDIGSNQLIFSPIRHQSRMIDQIVDNGLWSYEPEVSRLVFGNPFGYRTFLDGGAHVGIFASLAELSGLYEKVVAIEPNPTAAAYIRSHRDQNGLQFDLYECALGQEHGRVRFQVPITGYAMPSHASFDLHPAYRGQKTTDVEVDVRTLEEFILDGRMLVKLDCEGAEHDILASAIMTLSAREDVDFVLEINLGDDNRNRVFEMMLGTGYLAYLMTDKALVAEIRPMTLPAPGPMPKDGQARTIWRNHYFTKSKPELVERMSRELYGYFV